MAPEYTHRPSTKSRNGHAFKDPRKTPFAVPLTGLNHYASSNASIVTVY